MNSNVRRLKILYRLQSGKRTTPQSLMEEFSISKRTVYRDLKLIQELGVPVTYLKEEGYGVLRDGLIPPLMFTFRELSVIMMGLSFVQSQIDPEMRRDAESVALKISNSVPGSLQKKMHILEQTTKVSPYKLMKARNEDAGDWFMISMALADKKRITFTYKDQSGNISSRDISPAMLVHFTDHWNVMGYCHHKKDLRNFILSQMNQIVISPKKASFGDIDLDDMIYRDSNDMEIVTLKISREKSFSFFNQLPARIVEKKDYPDSVIVSFLFDRLDYINEWLLRFGDDVNIIEPARLVSLRHSLLKKMIKSGS